MVYARSLACGCIAGVGMAFFGCESAACECSYGCILDISMVCCICAHGRATVHTIKQSCTLVAHNISSVFLSLPAELHREKAACVACHKVNKCTSHPKQKTQNGQTTFPFPGGLCFFVRVFYLTEWLKTFRELCRSSWQPACQSVSIGMVVATLIYSLYQ